MDSWLQSKLGDKCIYPGELVARMDDPETAVQFSFSSSHYLLQSSRAKLERKVDDVA